VVVVPPDFGGALVTVVGGLMPPRPLGGLSPVFTPPTGTGLAPTGFFGLELPGGKAALTVQVPEPDELHPSLQSAPAVFPFPSLQAPLTQ
jgi:hypothetical protein